MLVNGQLERITVSLNSLDEILFDEKIGGSFHLAVGAGFPESGGKNKSKHPLGYDL